MDSASYFYGKVFQIIRFRMAAIDEEEAAAVAALRAEFAARRAALESKLAALRATAEADEKPAAVE